MKKLLISVAALSILAAAPAMAATGNFKKVDANGNGTISFQELKAAMPSATKAKFAAADKDKSGELSKKEFSSMKG
ncbi:MAG: EF-hand domain-containing protein [Alphaproteobacteria bacterium]|nr:MAG: EF-hand domain-containing protein [Alphaproteobacteria bacterium]